MARSRESHGARNPAGDSRNRRTRPPRSKRPGCLLVFLVGAGSLAVLLWFAPALIVHSPLASRFLRQAGRRLDLVINAGDVSAGWLSPLVVRDLTIQQASGEPLLRVSVARTSATLFDMLLRRDELGTITLERPELDIVQGPQGSNLETLIKRWQSLPSSGDRSSVAIETIDGTVRVRDSEAAPCIWRLHEATLRVPAQDGELTAQLAAGIEVEGLPTGSVAGELRWALRSEPGAGDSIGGQVRLVTAHFPLTACRVFLGRLLPAHRLEGHVSGNAELVWNTRQKQLRISSLSADQLSFASPTWLGSDRFSTDRLVLSGALSYGDAGWRLENLVVRSDVASLEVNGHGHVLAAPEGTTEAWGWWRTLNAVELRAEGDADLARLARMFPETLHLQKSVRITSGDSRFRLSVASLSNQQRCAGELVLRGVRGEREGRTLSLEAPVELTWEAATLDGQWQLNQLFGSSRFLRVTGAGSLQNGTLEFESDLDRFVEEVGQFIRFENLQLAGRIEGHAQWHQDANRLIDVQARAAAHGFQYREAGRSDWSENLLQLRLSARARRGIDGIEALEAAVVELVSQEDQCRLTLLRPVAPVTRQAAWPLDISLEGSLETWCSRLRRFLPSAAVSWQGKIVLGARGIVQPDRIQVEQARVDLRDWLAPWAGLRIQEPAVEIETDLIWNRAAESWSCSSVSVAGSSFAFRGHDIFYESVQGPRLSGTLGYRADLSRVSAWKPEADRRLAGQLVGRLQFDSADAITRFDASATTSDFELLERVAPPNDASPDRRWQTVWLEPELVTSCQGSWDRSADVATVKRLEIAADGLSIAGSGQVDGVQHRAEMQVRGELAYDLKRVSERFGTRLAGITLVGAARHPFTLRGPLRPDPHVNVLTLLAGTGHFSWDAANVRGVRIGPGKIDTDLRDGLLAVRAKELAVSEGTVSLAPTVNLKQSPTVLYHPAAPVAQSVRITPDMCQTWLKYVAPLVASATEAEGRFSLSLAEAEMPLGDPWKGRTSGVLDIHGARIGPGPLSHQVLLLADRVKSVLQRRPLTDGYQASSQWVTLPAQQVDFRVEQGRVEHRGLQMVAGDVTLRTSGTVDQHQRLALVVEVPIRDEWVVRDRWLCSVRGQTLNIPVAGTLSNPQLDLRALDQLARQVVTGAASRLLEQELGRGLERLFGPRE